MSVCIRTGAKYNRHWWHQGRCLKCGESQSKDIFSHVLPTEPDPKDVQIIGETILITRTSDSHPFEPYNKDTEEQSDLTDGQRPSKVKE